MILHRTLRSSCLRTTELLEVRTLRPLSYGERTGLWLHMRICRGCRAYARQSAALDRWLAVRMAPVMETGELEDRILRAVSGK